MILKYIVSNKLDFNTTNEDFHHKKSKLACKI